MQAIPLIIWPRFIGNLLRPDDYQTAATCKLHVTTCCDLGADDQTQLWRTTSHAPWASPS